MHFREYAGVLLQWTRDVWPLVLTAPLWRHGNGSCCLSPTFFPCYVEPIASTCPDNGTIQFIFYCYLPETWKGKAFAFGFCWRGRRRCFTVGDSSKVRQCVTANKHLMKSLTGVFALQQKRGEKEKQQYEQLLRWKQHILYHFYFFRLRRVQ